MSRSNPTSSTPHPCVRWFESQGQEGKIFYYDREKKEKVTAAHPFAFLLLDELAVVRGWHEASQSGIISNEVRDTRQEVFVVKTYGGLEIASGHYAMIRDRVAVAGGGYHASLYIAFRYSDGSLKIGNMNLRGAALSAWLDFRKEQRTNVVEVNGKKIPAIYAKAICIKDWKDGKKGSINFKSPVFAMSEVKPETAQEAVELDRQLQEYLTDYFKRRKAEAPAQRSDESAQPDAPVESQSSPEPEPEPAEMASQETAGDDVPF